MKSVCGSCLVSASGGRRINLVLLKQSVAEVASLERHLSLRGVFFGEETGQLTASLRLVSLLQRLVSA